MTAFLDTNVLFYAQGTGAKSDIARQAILASALEAGCDTLLTEDLQGGQRIVSLTVVNPFL